MGLLGASRSDAVGVDPFKAALEKNGYAVTLEADVVQHATLSADGVVMTVAQGTRSARIEQLPYESNAKLKEDWIAVNGKGPALKLAANDFAGRILYWNNDNMLAIDLQAPNDPYVAIAAAKILPGGPGTGGPLPLPGTQPVTVPSTGRAPAYDAGPNFLFTGLALATAGIAVTVSAVVVARRLASARKEVLIAASLSRLDRPLVQQWRMRSL